MQVSRCSRSRQNPIERPQGSAGSARRIRAADANLLDIRAALAADSYVLPTQHLSRGQPREMLARAPHRLRGTLSIGGQDHFYLEGQIAIAIPQEDGALLIHSSTQHPSEVQQVVAHALGKRAHDITVRCRRMGGGFGGKETQPALIAAAAAILALKASGPSSCDWIGTMTCSLPASGTISSPTTKWASMSKGGCWP